jgi:hypothetical protein
LVLSGEDGDTDVDVVVHDHLGFARYRTQDPSHVLDNAAFELDREGQEDVVEGGSIEAFADEPRVGPDRRA